MILQDLIRNVFLYKGVIKPFLKSWKENLIAPSSASLSLFENNLASFGILKTFQGPFPSRIEAAIAKKAVSAEFNSRLGTHTIVITKAISLQYLSSEIVIRIMEVVTNGSTIITMLMNDEVHKQVVTATKTMTEQLTKDKNLTTGFANLTISSFLFHETHEKREYLGEFSLHHEEALLMYQKGRR
jgi:hypothetical protein